MADLADLADYLETPGPYNEENEHGLNALSEEAIEPGDVPNIGTRWTTSLMNIFSTPILSLQYQKSAFPWQEERSLLALQTPCNPPLPSIQKTLRAKPKSLMQPRQPTSSISGSRGAAHDNSQRLDRRPITFVLEHFLQAEFCT